MARIRKPKFPLRLYDTEHGMIVVAANGVSPSDEEIAWLNRAAESYGAERLKLRRALQHALPFILALWPADGPPPEESAMIQEIQDALSASRRKR